MKIGAADVETERSGVAVVIRARSAAPQLVWTNVTFTVVDLYVEQCGAKTRSKGLTVRTGANSRAVQ
jgi:hypothetical protein